jgi:hypothetical protein
MMKPPENIALKCTRTTTMAEHFEPPPFELLYWPLCATSVNKTGDNTPPNASTENEVNETQAFALLHLPRELRNKIYQETLMTECHINLIQPIGLLAVSHQVRLEVREEMKQLFKRGIPFYVRSRDVYYYAAELLGLLNEFSSRPKEKFYLKPFIWRRIKPPTFGDHVGRN